ncbi:MAG: aspartate kinase [Polyangiales bacterium]
MSTIIVQKYGGSSVADLDRLGRVADKIVETARAGHAVVVVVSAMGKTTDALLAQARQVDAEPPRRELDMLVSTGERVSMALLSIAIQKRGFDAISFTGSQAGIITTERHFDARIVAVRAHRVHEELDRGRIVIVAGYQGVSEKKEITTLGRGGSDTTAVALAAALSAERCEIYSDVDGVYSADPRVVPDAKHLAYVDYETLQIAAETGAKVLNAQAVEWAKRAGIEIHARHTGQSYSGAVPSPGSKQTIVSAASAGAALVSAERGLVRAHLEGATLSEFLAACADADVMPRDLSFDGARATAIFSLLNAPDWARSRRALADRIGTKLRLEEGLACATAIGDGLTSSTGALRASRLATLLDTLPTKGACVAPLRVSLLVDEAALDATTRALHAAVDVDR